MPNRHLVIASVWLGLLSWSVSWNEPAFAQQSEQDVHVLPPTVVTPTKPKPKRRPEQAVSREPGPNTNLVVYPTAPLPGADVAADKVPAFTSVVTSAQIEETHSANIDRKSVV